MDSRKKTRLIGKMRVTALMTAAYHESAQKSKQSSCLRYCGWSLFGYAACIVMLCLGVTVIILGGVFTKIDLYILGGVFVVGSLVLFIIVCTPGESCGRKRRVTQSSANLKEGVNEVEQATPRPARKPLKYTQRHSFLRNLGNAVMQETAIKRKLSSDAHTTSREWVKMVEQTKSRKTNATIEEEPKVLSESQIDTKEEPNNYSDTYVHFQNNAEDDVRIELEASNAPGTVTSFQSDSKDDFKETTTTDIQMSSSRGDEGKTTVRRNYRLDTDMKEHPPSKQQTHSASITSVVDKTNSSSQITEVSIHTDPHIHLEVMDHSSKTMDIDGDKSDNTKEALCHLEEKTDVESGHRKKRRKKKKRKKTEIELKEESDLNHNTPDIGDQFDGTVHDNEVGNSARLPLDHSVSRDTLQRLDTDLL